MTLERHRLKITGIVQGVGFRPFIYKLAVSLCLKGWVCNTGEGVVIEVEGTTAALRTFADSIRTGAPPLSVIRDIAIGHLECLGYNDFKIVGSIGDSGRNTSISPDMSVCADCSRELYTPGDYRYLYPFINCTNCGPRFTIIKDVPYDRQYTTMDRFGMCDVCRAEYEDPADRRYHAQPVSCSRCGPVLSLLDKYGNKIDCSDIPYTAGQFLAEGKILAVKGLGGYHLACDAVNPAAVRELRRRKHRDEKPFALMAADTATVLKYCIVGDKEKALLESIKKPIVLLGKRDSCSLPDEIAPRNKHLGIMLPYTPLHLLMFDPGGTSERICPEILVMTSGNKSSEPVCYKDDEALKELQGIADYFLANDREIYMRTDDTVTRVFMGGEYPIRRSRGYVPAPILINVKQSANIPHILACGGELKNTFCLGKGNEFYMSHHIGDLENLETMQSFEEGIVHFERLFDIKPGVVAYDMHPGYLSTRYALDCDIAAKVPVQHHHAHIASCMAENNLTGDVIGVAFDGTGYGTDGKIWGSEFFTGTYGNFSRICHLNYVKMPGGEAAIREPWRMAASYVYEAGLDLGEYAALAGMRGNTGLTYEAGQAMIGEGRLGVIWEALEKNFNCPPTCGMGRMFDAVSALAGLRNISSFEGQAAMELEYAVSDGYHGQYEYGVDRSNGIFTIDTREIVRGVVRDRLEGASAGIIAAKFHETVAAVVEDVCRRVRGETGLARVVVSGGVFQNTLLLSKCFNRLDKGGFQVFIHRLVPANDGGIALGQAVTALAANSEVCGSLLEHGC